MSPVSPIVPDDRAANGTIAECRKQNSRIQPTEQQDARQQNNRVQHDNQHNRAAAITLDAAALPNYKRFLFIVSMRYLLVLSGIS